ncbi:DUF2493 domain-containing protein [Kineosporia sp. J2-2]|uniref:DUF2493 domain-containing protein n=1 Tax=Kineosporia corallincola TaxID=2835133 RepID=A0ABS5TJU7_9ACTN|nr:SLOG family protein [Kineosporia corallincola]MBT0771365.1 DUF2493 domain-containing protein [Kineosporia corallincola]
MSNLTTTTMATAENAVRVLVTGSRDWSDAEAITLHLEGLRYVAGRVQRPGLVVVHGACPTGADAIAAAWARAHDVPVEAHPAQWATHGRAAGPLRNRAMVTAGADVCVAFILNGSRGATGCADLAEAAGIPTYRITRPGRACGRPEESWEIRGGIAQGLSPRCGGAESLPCPRHGEEVR